MTQQAAIVRTDEPYSQPPTRSGLLDMLRRWPDAAAQLLIVAVALVLTWHTWARWGNLQIDCGKGLYVPAEILRGKLLYRDIWYPYGPLTPYLLAGLIGTFGRHLNVLYCFGISLAVCCALLLYQIGAMLEGRAVGLVAGIALLVRAFGPTQFNFAFPYTYAAPLGLLLSLLSAFLTTDYVLNGVPNRLILSACTAGLALLCKPEMGAACCLMLVCAIGIEGLLEKRIRTLLLGVVKCLPALVVSAGVYGWFCWKLGTRFLLYDNLHALPGSRVWRSYVSRQTRLAGLRFIPVEIILLSVMAALGLVAWLLLARSARWCRRSIWDWRFAACLAMIIAGVAGARYMSHSGQSGYLSAITQASHAGFLAAALTFPPGMYFIGCGFLLYTLYEFARYGQKHAAADVVFTIFALTLAVRVMVGVVVAYDFTIFYVWPLVLVFAAVLMRCFRSALAGIMERRRRKLINVLFALEMVLLTIIFVPGASLRTAPFETSWGTIYLTAGEARVARKIFSFVSTQKRLSRRVVMLPETTIMYALTGTEAPSRWYAFFPGCLIGQQDDEYLSNLGRALPNYIVLTNERTGGYGRRYFGLDYNRKIYRWIEANYRVVGQFGDFRREKGAPLAALIYKRRGGVKPAVSPTGGSAQEARRGSN